jgi:hypothetical protein
MIVPHKRQYFDRGDPLALEFRPACKGRFKSKGDIDIGLDADLVLLDPNETWTIKSSESESGQGYTPFAVARNDFDAHCRMAPQQRNQRLGEQPVD